ncbi:nucleophile aminohydrolase, partial [Ochromonadaceae sp. CCMP2298]
MPGVSSRAPVAGAGGYGKVYLRFKPREPKRWTVKKALAPFVYLFFIAGLIISYSWSRPALKYDYVVPLLRRALGGYDWYKQRTGEWVALLGPADATTAATAATAAAGIKRDSFGVPSFPIPWTEDGAGAKEVVDAGGVGAGRQLNHALYQQGLAHASDRLLQMDTLRRTALGRLSQVHGNITLLRDTLHLALDLARLAKRDWASLGASEKAELQAYSDGVNAYLAKARREGSYSAELDLLYAPTMGQVGQALKTSLLGAIQVMGTGGIG